MPRSLVIFCIIIFAQCVCGASASLLWSEKDINATLFQSTICSQDQVPRITFDNRNLMSDNDDEAIFTRYITKVILRCEGRRGGMVEWNFYGKNPESTVRDRIDGTDFLGLGTWKLENDFSDFNKVSTFSTTVELSVNVGRFLRRVKSLALTCDYIHPSPCRVNHYVSVKFASLTQETNKIQLKQLQKSESAIQSPEYDYTDVTFYIYWENDYSFKWSCLRNGTPVTNQKIYFCTWYPGCTFPISSGRNVKPRLEIMNSTEFCRSSGCASHRMVLKANRKDYWEGHVGKEILTCYEDNWRESWPFVVVLPSLELYDGFPKYYYSTMDVPVSEFMAFEPLPKRVHIHDTIQLIVNTKNIDWMSARFAYKNRDGSTIVIPSGDDILHPLFEYSSYRLNVTIDEEMKDMISIGLLLSMWDGTEQVGKFANITVAKEPRKDGNAITEPPIIKITPITVPISFWQETALFEGNATFNLSCTHSKPIIWFHEEDEFYTLTPSGKNDIIVRISPNNLRNDRATMFTCRTTEFNSNDYTVAVVKPLLNGTRSLLQIVPYFEEPSSQSEADSQQSSFDETEQHGNKLYYLLLLLLLLPATLCVFIWLKLRHRRSYGQEGQEFRLL